MVNKNKNTQHFESVVATASEQLGMFVVGLATVINVAGLAHREGHTGAAVLKPAYAMSQNLEFNTTSNELRRAGREEIRHTSASYGTVLRSPDTAGSI